MEKQKIYDNVKVILDTYPQARRDDMFLYAKYLEIHTDAPIYTEYFADLIVNHIGYGLPSYESITRARRKVQADYPELADDSMRKKRAKLEQEYREYYGEKGLLY